MNEIPTDTRNVDNDDQIAVELVMEGSEKCHVQLDQGNSAASVGQTVVRGKRRILHQVYALNSSNAKLVGSEDAVLRFRIQVPADLPHTLPMWSSNDLTGDCHVYYQIAARVCVPRISTEAQESQIEQGGNLNLPHVLSSPSISMDIRKRPRKCLSDLSLAVGDPFKIPVSALCGLYTHSYRDSYNFRPIDSLHETMPFCVFPGQVLRVSLVDSVENWREKAAKSVWKLTQRIQWTASDQYRMVQVPCQLTSWEEKLKEVGSGLVTIPDRKGPLRMSHTGRTIRATHEMVVFSYGEDDTLLGTSIPISVTLTSGYL